MPIAQEITTGLVPVKIWTPDLEATARRQLENVSRLPIVYGHIAAMPDVHAGIGATVGSVIPTRSAVIPAAAGVDLGCGVNAVQLSLHANDLPTSLGRIRSAIEHAVPVGFETHENLCVTRKGAIRAGRGEMGVIPGSMGAKSFIVRGKGNPESLCSCAHGAGRLMSRNEAKKRFTKADVQRQTEGVECRKDSGVVDEIPGAYKPIAEVMANQSDLVDVVHTLKQALCVKG
jgi:RNA-splicing ligase RtcB